MTVGVRGFAIPCIARSAPTLIAMKAMESSARWRGAVAVAVGAVVLRIVFGVSTWAPGWSALTWDDFTRVAIAQEWAAAPYVADGLVWLPLPVWITGSVFAIAGRWFLESPMALMAMLNTAAVMVASAISAWSAHRLFGSRIGTLGVFLLTLFAPWAYFLSLSGLAEPLYFVAIALTSAGLVSWAASGQDRWLGLGSFGVAAAAAMRYEGWWLAAAFLAVICVDALLLLRTHAVRFVVRSRARSLAIAAAPFVVPVAWMAVNVAQTGSPTTFARESARYFESAYGGFERRLDRLVYYPAAMVRAAPILLLLEGVAAFVHRRRRGVVLLVGLFATQFLLFYGASAVTGAYGAFPERFLFAYALGLSPLVAGLPGAFRAARVPAGLGRLLGAGLVAIVVLGTMVRLGDRPVEWTHAPDLLALNEQLGAVTTDGRNVTVVIGEGTEIDVIPMRIQNGDRVEVLVADGLLGTPARASLWAERVPFDVVALDLPADPSIGRYRLGGPMADQMTLSPCDGCDGWLWRDEAGIERPVGGGPYLGLEFTTDDPAPGQRTALIKRIQRTPDIGRGSVDLRWLYGHGFNRGRMNMVVVLDDEPIFRADIGDPSRWTEVRFDVPPGQGTSELRIEVVALEGIEDGWAWGRASTVLVRRFSVETQ